MTEATNYKVCISRNRYTFKKVNVISNVLIFLYAIAPLIIGGIIYLLFRPDSIRLFHWLSVANLAAPVDFIRNYSVPLASSIPEWIIFSLPNGLWVFSYAFLMAYLWCDSKSAVKYFWLTSVPVVGLGYETLQLMGVIPGIFCYQDLLLCILGIISGVALAMNLKGRRLKKRKP